MTPQRRLEGRTALITGASRGIGRAVALGYAREGAHVILLSRTSGALEEVDDAVRGVGGTATLVPMNLADASRVDALGPGLYERWGHLDILVANAGVLGPLTPLNHVSDDEWTSTLEINLTANWRLIRTLDPLLRRAEAGRAIFVTSGAARSCRAYWGPYAVSKAGLEALVKVYAAELVDTNARANLLDPGVVATDMRAKAFPGEDPKTLAAPDKLAALFVDMALPEFTANGECVRFEASG